MNPQWRPNQVPQARQFSTAAAAYHQANPHAPQMPAMSYALPTAGQKRKAHSSPYAGIVNSNHQYQGLAVPTAAAKKRAQKRRVAEMHLHDSLKDLIPESEMYMKLVDFERKLDSTATRKKADIQVHASGVAPLMTFHR